MTMKKIFTLLLVVVMTVSCFVGCKPADGNNGSGGKIDLDETFGQFATVLEDADAFKEEFDLTVSVTVNQPLFSDEMLGQLLGEEGAVALPILKPFIKNDKTLEVPMSADYLVTKDGKGQMSFVLGTGDDAFAFNGVVANNDLYLNMKDVYVWLAGIMEVVAGAEMPVWPMESEYVSFMDVMALIQELQDSSQEDIYFSPVNAASDFAVVAPGESFEDSLEGILGMNGMNPEMIMAIADALMEAIPEQSIMDLVNILEATLEGADMLSEKDGYVTITFDGDKVKKLPDAFANAAKGKLGKAIDSIINGIKNSDNEIIASLIPEDVAISGSEIETLLLTELQAAKEEVNAVAAQLKAMNFVVEYGFKVSDKGIAVKGFVQASVEEDGISVTMKVSTSGTLETAKDVTIQAPDNVLTKTELSDFIAGFMAGMEEGFVG